MPHFANIAADGKPACIVDLDDVLLVNDLEENVTLVSRTQGQFAGLKKEDGAAERIAALMEAAGIPMIRFPVRWPDNETGENTFRFNQFARADAFSYATTSVFETQKDGTEQCGMLMGVDGYGRLESTGVTREEEAEILAKAQAANTGLRRIDPEEAHARFYAPGYTLYDPAKINRIYADSCQVNVIFSGQDRLDFSTPETDMNRILTIMRTEKPGITDEEIMQGFYQARERINTGLRATFARAVAAQAPQLLEIEGSKQAYYTRPDTVGVIYVGDKNDVMTIFYRKTAAQSYAEHEHVRFETPEQMQAAMAKLTAPKVTGP